MTPELVLDARAQLGEGPIWDDRRQRLLFVDIMRGHVHEFDPVTKTDRTFEAGEPVGTVAPTTRVRFGTGHGNDVPYGFAGSVAATAAVCVSTGGSRSDRKRSSAPGNANCVAPSPATK